MPKFLVIRLYFLLDALNVRTVLVHLQEQLYKLYMTFGIYQMRCTTYKVAPEDGLNCPKHVEHLMENKV